MIAAAGSGTRLGAGGPKAMVQLAGRPMLAWSLEALGAARSIGTVLVAAPPDAKDEFAAVAGDAEVVAGGESRSESVAAALERVPKGVVVVHDAARPLAPTALFDETVEALAASPDLAGVVAAAPVADTLKRAGGEPPVVSESLDRAGIWAIQTPQAFRSDALREALAVPAADLASATDDAMLVERAGGRVGIHPWGEPNLKVTTAADLAVAEALLR